MQAIASTGKPCFYAGARRQSEVGLSLPNRIRDQMTAQRLRAGTMKRFAMLSRKSRPTAAKLASGSGMWRLSAWRGNWI